MFGNIALIYRDEQAAKGSLIQCPLCGNIALIYRDEQAEKFFNSVPLVWKYSTNPYRLAEIRPHYLFLIVMTHQYCFIFEYCLVIVTVSVSSQMVFPLL